MIKVLRALSANTSILILTFPEIENLFWGGQTAMQDASASIGIAGSQNKNFIDEK